MSKDGRVVLELVDTAGEAVKLLLTLPDGRQVDMQPAGEVSRKEARVIRGAIMNAMRAGLRADQSRHGRVLREERP